jgi:hypothetical protein
VGGFLATIGIAQAALFGGKNPRAASMLAGMVFLGIAFTAMEAFADFRRFDWQNLISMLGCICPWGAVLGYLGGAVIGGLFLIADWLRPFTNRS